MPLVGYKSLCTEKQPIIVSKDKRTPRIHRAMNTGKSCVTQYQIDGCVIKSGSTKCDFLVMNEDKLNAYLIELKGSDIEHGIDQLEGTAQQLRAELSSYTVKYRLVYSRARTHAVQGLKFKKFLKAHAQKDEFLYKENILEENI